MNHNDDPHTGRLPRRTLIQDAANGFYLSPLLSSKQGREHMTQQEIEKKRKYFFMGIAALATAITLASASATYAINEKSFVDWKEWQSVLAFLATVGTEATFSLSLYGVTYALTGATEKRLGVALLLGTVAVMAANYTIHHKLNIHASLSDWQVAYVQWIGPLSLFGILLLIVSIIVFNHDAKKRAQDREFAFAAERKAMEWRQKQLESAAFEQHMEQYQDQVFEEARRSLKLSSPQSLPGPAYGSSQPPRIGYRPDERDEVDLFPKIQPNRD
jgi:cell division protein FtsL